MALASSSSSFGSLAKKNGTPSNNKNGTSTTALDFYESMYHLKKMFPKLDSEVIESVLRSNQGQVDKTLDQLLTITMDDELNEIRQDDTLGAAATLVANNIPAVAEKPADAQLTLISDDLPPSYHEFMTSISTTTTTSVTVTQQPKPENSQIVREEDNFDPFGLQSVSKQQKQQSSTLNDFQVQASAIKTRKESSNGESTAAGATSLVNGKSGVLFPVVSVMSENRYNWRSRAMTGELRKDFLRVKLTNEQLKKFKSSIKKAKRDEITAIVNNKTPENPELSFELRRQMNELTGNGESSESESEQFADVWHSKYDDLLKTFDKRHQQLANDEYIAKMIQKEEEIKKSQGRRSSLVDDFDWKLKVDDKQDNVSNDDFKLKSNSGTASKMKFGLLSTKMNTKSKSNKSIDNNSINSNPLNAEETDSISSNYSSASKKDGEDNSDEESYNVDRIKWLEEFGSKSGNANGSVNPQNRYKKAYQSFKLAIKRSKPSTSVLTNGLATLQKSRAAANSNRKNADFEFLDQNNNNLLDSYKDTGAIIGGNNKYSKLNDSSSNQLGTDLMVFQDDYSYDNETKDAKTTNSFDLFYKTPSSNSSKKLFN